MTAFDRCLIYLMVGALGLIALCTLFLGAILATNAVMYG